MSEFDKLMRGESQRPEVRERKAKKDQHTKTMTWWLLRSFVLMIIPPHIGGIVFLPLCAYLFIRAAIEWMG